MAIKRGQPVNLKGAGRVFGALLLLYGLALLYVSQQARSNLEAHPSWLSGTGEAARMRSSADNMLFSGLVLGAGGVTLILVSTRSGRTVAQNETADRYPCPYCAELIRHEAIKCRFCGSDVRPMSPEAGRPEASGGGRDASIDAAGLSSEQLIRQIADELNVADEPYDPNRLFELGRQYALLYDTTHDTADRQKALKYMRAAQEADSGPFSTLDVREFGSLMGDSEFRDFVP